MNQPPISAPDDQARLNAVLREGERVLWQGKGGSGPAAPPAGLLARFFGRKAQAAPATMLYAITARRVLALPPQGEPQEWFLMLGLVHNVFSHSRAVRAEQTPETLDIDISLMDS